MTVHMKHYLNVTLLDHTNVTLSHEKCYHGVQHLSAFQHVAEDTKRFTWIGLKIAII